MDSVTLMAIGAILRPPMECVASIKSVVPEFA